MANTKTWPDPDSHLSGQGRKDVQGVFLLSPSTNKPMEPGGSVATVFKTIAAVAVTAATPVNVWTPASGKKFRLLGYALSLSVAGSVILKDNTTEIIRTPLMAAGIGQSSPPQMGNGILSTAADQILKIDVSATGNVSGFVFGTEE